MLLGRNVICALAAIVGTLVSAGNTAAGKFNEKMDIGEKAPPFEDLAGVDGENHGIKDFKEAKVLVVAFTCNHCPVARAYEERFIDFTKEYGAKGVAFVAVNSNTVPADRLDKMKERAKEEGFNFPYLYDESQKVGKSFGAAVTPHLFVLDGERRIAYMGAFDNSLDPDKAKDHYVRDAVDALLAGKKPEVAETRQFGCGIQYNNR